MVFYDCSRKGILLPDHICLASEIRHELGSGNFSAVRLGVDVKDKASQVGFIATNCDNFGCCKLYDFWDLQQLYLSNYQAYILYI